MNPPFRRYAITDRLQISRSEENLPHRDSAAAQLAGLLRQAQQLASEGVDYLQLREKDLPAGEVAALARSLLDVLGGSKTKLLLNARADIAVATAAHGVHLTAAPDELSPRQIHDLYAAAHLPAPIVTISCHTLDDVTRHRLEPVTALLFGPVYEKVLSPASPTGATRIEGTGLDSMRQACEAAAPIPVFALGGITSQHIADCIRAGAKGIAGIRLFNQPRRDGFI